MILALAIVSLLCAVVPAAMMIVNLRLYVPPPEVARDQTLSAVSILIPARNEAAGIADALHAALATGGEFEIIVMDDSSTDSTAVIVQRIVGADPRVRLLSAPALPPGWNGKQHACWALAQAARHPMLCFVDADVRLAPDCVPRMTRFLERTNSGLVSGFPRQVTVTFLEWLLLPLIHFVLLGFLPIARMRASSEPAYAAGCGQFLLCRRDAYFECGGHSGIRLTMHDGLLLPRLFRQHGYRTDLADITDLATCRMYTSARQVWSGLAKNATEGLAAPARIVPLTLILFLGQVVPVASLFALLIMASLVAFIMSGSITGPATVDDQTELVIMCVFIAASAVFAWLPRILAARRFRQSWRSVVLHPIGVLLLIILQWYALLRKLIGAPTTWRTRTYPSTQ